MPQERRVDQESLWLSDQLGQDCAVQGLQKALSLLRCPHSAGRAKTSPLEEYLRIYG